MTTLFVRNLVKRGFVTESQMLEALDRQRYQIMPLATIALQTGKLTTSEIREVLRRKQQCPKPFGTIAQELGFLAHKDVDELLKLQLARSTSGGDDNHPELVEILVDMGAIERTVMEREREIYKKNKDE